tara:strand:- start:310 stop:711 length:402 start_codon:yes stop_codon:yes gene_type:complete
MKIFRPASADDMNFILNSWLKSYKDSVICENIPANIYYEEHKKTVETHIANSSIIMAVNPEDPDQIFGYCVYEAPMTLHYMYVKYPFRKFGIGKDLYLEAGSPTIVSHLPRDYKTLKKKYGLIYTPYIKDTNI